tara:strand:- start:1458 stop:2765 length:1308 start_codon:yes stop_codon:yes gene_type:complete
MVISVATKVQLKRFPKQREFIESDKPFSAFIGGVGSGKTQGGAIKLLVALGNNPGSLWMVTAPTYPMLKDSTLRTVLELFPEAYYTMHVGEMRLEFANGAEVLFRSTDDPERLRGPNLSGVWMDEAARSSGEAFKILQGRLRQEGARHQLWITTTPKGFNWVYQEFAAEPRPDYFMINVSARDNPFLPKDFIKRLQESYSHDFALQEIEGEFVLVGGNPFFDTERLKDMLNECEEPHDVARGLLSYWKPPGVGLKYLAAGDLAWGEKGAYSCFVVVDWQTMEQVAELHGRPAGDDCAREAVDLCKMYNNAFVGVEANGEGQSIVTKMVELGYGLHMFHRKKGDSRSTPGWITDPTNRPVILANYEEAVRRRAVRIKCREAVSEHMSFVRNDKGRPEPTEGAFGDHVMTWAILWEMRHHARFGVEATSGPVYVRRT